jgi:hypothetical protein
MATKFSDLNALDYLVWKERKQLSIQEPERSVPVPELP